MFTIDTYLFLDRLFDIQLDYYDVVDYDYEAAQKVATLHNPYALQNPETIVDAIISRKKIVIAIIESESITKAEKEITKRLEVELQKIVDQYPGTEFYYYWRLSGTTQLVIDISGAEFIV